MGLSGYLPCKSERLLGRGDTMNRKLFRLGGIALSLSTVSMAAESLPSNVINWESGRDFAAGTYDVFYENDLLLAMPSIYANNLQDLVIANPESAQACSRTDSIDAGKWVHIRSKDIERAGRDKAPLYLGDKEIGKLNEVQIDAHTGWRLLTFPEAQRSAMLERWQKGFCFLGKTRLGDKYFGAKGSVLTYTAGGAHNKGAWTALALGQVVETNNNGSLRWKQTEYATESSPVVLVRTPSAIEHEVLGNPRLDISGRIKRYAELMANQTARPERQPLAKPALAALPAQPVLVKDEFETTTAFEQRKQRELEAWRKRSDQVEQGNAQLLASYDQAMNAAEHAYQSQLAQLQSEAGKARIQQEVLQQAVLVVLGKPYFRDLHYDADTQRMQGMVFSATSPDFSKPVSIPVPLAQAHSFKQDLQDKKLVPQVQMDQDLNILAVNVVTNDKKIALEFDLAKSQDTETAYQEFMAQYPQAPQVKAAQAAIAKIQQQKMRAEQQRQRDDAARSKREAEKNKAEMQAYQAPKSVGDQVCRPARLALGIVNITMRAYVERVESGRMQLRIVNLDGQNSVYYNGVALERDSLIWDRINEWKTCR